MRMVFDADESDRIYVVGDPGWITGQSYLIAAPLSVGMCTIISEGSPLFPHAGRFSSIIERHGATIFKAGSTFLKAVMTDPASIRGHGGLRHERRQGRDLLRRARVAGGAAIRHGPHLPALHQFLLGHGARRHGVLLPLGRYQAPRRRREDLAPALDQAEVRIAEDGAAEDSAWREAEVGEKGELVITQPYPYLARTIWGDADALGSDDWRGDIERFASVYFNRWSGRTTPTRRVITRAPTMTAASRCTVAPTT
jgi:acrylyl-CoA reductase (NADPH)/3-hydroxypropionyl-CoA dehydratase/3-hydroxypropionyl-CoA synthetase